MFFRVILLFLLFAGAVWGFISIAPHITGKQWVTTSKFVVKAVVCAIISVLIIAIIAFLQQATN